MPSKIRLRRINDRMREDLSELLLMEVEDPRLAGIMVTDVKVDREFAYADIYVSAIEGQDRLEEVMNGLERAKGFIRRRLAQQIQLRSFPQLRFHWDPTPEKADRIENLLYKLREESKDTELSQNNDEE